MDRRARPPLPVPRLPGPGPPRPGRPQPPTRPRRRQPRRQPHPTLRQPPPAPRARLAPTPRPAPTRPRPLDQPARPHWSSPRGPDTLKPDSGLGEDVLVSGPSKYPEEFRRDAVELVLSSPSRTLRGVARELGVSRETLRSW